MFRNGSIVNLRVRQWQRQVAGTAVVVLMTSGLVAGVYGIFARGRTYDVEQRLDRIERQNEELMAQSRNLEREVTVCIETLARMNEPAPKIMDLPIGDFAPHYGRPSSEPPKNLGGPQQVPGRAPP
jgi:hypothetical protein